MFRSLKSKFIVAFGTLILLLFLLLGFFLVNEKEQELSQDIASASQSFAVLSAEAVMDNYELYLKPGNFIAFTREVQSLLRKNTDVTGVQVISYSGVVLYNSSEESKEMHSGSLRTIPDEATLKRIQASKASLVTELGRVIYLNIKADGTLQPVDENEKLIAGLDPSERILNIAIPNGNTHTVLYGITYEAMELRLALVKKQIFGVTGLGLILTFMIAYMFSVSITNPLKELKESALKIAGGDFKVRVKIRSRDEIGILGQSFNLMAKDLAESTQALVYQERIKKELDLAAQIQKDLLPEEKLELPNLDFAGGVIPATEIGGDAFDYIKMNDGRYLTYLGDVTGHGVPAGIISSSVNAVLYALRDQKNLSVIVKHLNEVLRQKTSSRLFVTMALTLWDESTSTLLYTNAGHPPVLFYNAAEKKVTEIKLQGVALGMVDGLEKLVQECKFEMKENDAFIMYSDGVPEAVDKAGEPYGMGRLKRIAQDASNDLFSAEGIKNAILSDVIQYIGELDHSDDITVVVLKRKA